MKRLRILGLPALALLLAGGPADAFLEHACTSIEPLRVLVVGPLGTPLAGYTVEVAMNGSGAIASGVTGSDGFADVDFDPEDIVCCEDSGVLDVLGSPPAGASGFSSVAILYHSGEPDCPVPPGGADPKSIGLWDFGNTIAPICHGTGLDGVDPIVWVAFEAIFGGCTTPPGL